MRTDTAHTVNCANITVPAVLFAWESWATGTAIEKNEWETDWEVRGEVIFSPVLTNVPYFLALWLTPATEDLVCPFYYSGHSALLKQN